MSRSPATTDPFAATARVLVTTRGEHRLEPMSVKGRYFLFASRPPLAVMLDARTVLALRLCEDRPTVGEVLTRHRELTRARGVSEQASDESVHAALTALRASGVIDVVDA
ncbi:hypothetical protein [Streptomyces sp. DH37]|jgi:hypothetical protein|uniref:hypothetical protein n=1 Tax=Streptomyces sp. DH37 TaxID=3040122 RepID=UPI0024410486|nr:hypothetical protein [Streptomyces sp. DH37]MDG9701542.1 hypothetical protein [Streptomyces sp. DH37]